MPRASVGLTKRRSWASQYKGHTSRTSLHQHCPLNYVGPECVVQPPGEGTCADIRTHVSLVIAVS